MDLPTEIRFLSTILSKFQRNEADITVSTKDDNPEPGLLGHVKRCSLVALALTTGSNDIYARDVISVMASTMQDDTHNVTPVQVFIIAQNLEHPPGITKKTTLANISESELLEKEMAMYTGLSEADNDADSGRSESVFFCRLLVVHN